ncbi:MAG TPA: dihydrofolate reductase family protein, partial [Solirubrobacteraceae bacterium]|nr:dihydrofolate reductase family protein [Solirubrobacteraceae bacterium]
DVPWEIGLFAEPSSRVLVYSGVDVRPPAGVSAQVEVVAGTTEPADVLADLRARHGAQVVSCEGGPTLLHALLAAELVDDLVLTLAPLLLAGDAPAVVAGDPLDPPVGLALASVHRAEDHLMLRYRRP